MAGAYYWTGVSAGSQGCQTLALLASRSFARSPRSWPCAIGTGQSALLGPPLAFDSNNLATFNF
jgi:hypothetical protein